MGSTERRWRLAAEQALSSAKLVAAREAMAAQLAEGLWLANGGPAWALGEQEGALLMLEVLANRLLEDEAVWTATALRYLQALEENRRSADYEDQAALGAELQWTRGYLQGRLDGRAVPGGPALSGESPAQELASLHQRLASRLQAELKAAEIAA